MNNATTDIPHSEKRTYTVDEIATILEIGRTSSYNLIKENHFNTVRIGTSIRVSKNSFDNWLDSFNN